jgi:hypothetical protein
MILILFLQVVEKLVVSGSLGIEEFASALEKRHKHQSTLLKSQQQDLSVVLALGKVLSVSTESKVIDFLKMLYVKLFNLSDDHKHRLRQVCFPKVIFHISSVGIQLGCSCCAPIMFN